MQRRSMLIVGLLITLALALAVPGTGALRTAVAQDTASDTYASVIRSFHFVSSVADGHMNDLERISSDASGNIYVSEDAADVVRMYTKEGAFVRQYGYGYGSGDGYFNAPLGATVYGGELYVADWGNARIQVFNQATGAWVRSFGTYGSGFGQFKGPQAVAFGPDGYLYVVESGNMRVQLLTSAGVSIAYLTAGWSFPTSIAFDSKGCFYVTDVNGNTVKKIRRESGLAFTLVRQWASTAPISISIDRSDNIYVGQRDDFGFQVYNWQGALMASYHAHGTMLGAFGDIATIAVVATTNSGPIVWTTDNANQRLQRFAWTIIPVSHTYQAQWGGLPVGSANGQFNNPLAVAVDNLQNIYVTDRGNNRVQKFDRYGNFILAWGSAGSGDGQFSGLYSIGYNPSNGMIYTTEVGNDRVQYFNTSGVYQGKWGSLGSGDDQLNEPAGIAFDAAGYVYVADEVNHRIVKYTTTGTYVRQWGSYGTGNGQFRNPSGVAVDLSRRLVYVSEFLGARVQIFNESGGFIAVVADSLAGPCDLNMPLSIIADQRGSVYVTDRGNSRVVQYDTNGKCVGFFGSSGSGSGQFNGLMGIAFNGKSGQLYTVEWSAGNNRVQRFGSPLPKNDRVGIWRPSMRSFYLRLTNSTGPADITVNLSMWALSDDKPVVGDWNGDGIDTVGLYRNGRFLLKDSNSPGWPDYDFTLGNPGDLPFAGDWDGDGKDGVGVFRPSNGIVYLKNTLGSGYADYSLVMGVAGDVGVGGDWNADGQDSPGIFRPSQARFYLSNKVVSGIVYADFSFVLGNPGDAPFMGDWVFQGWSGAGVFRPTNGITYLKNVLAGGYADVSMVYGIAGDAPVGGQWGPKPTDLMLETDSIPLKVETQSGSELAPIFEPPK